MKLELADIATNERHKLNGFKVFGFIPFYLKYIRVDVHIQLAKIREQIQQITSEPKANDFYDSKIQEASLPLIIEYCVTALLNKRKFSWILRFFIKEKVKKCSHMHILNLYTMITQLNQPAFFLTYWKSLNVKDNTILSEVKQSSEKSSNTNKKQE